MPSRIDAWSPESAMTVSEESSSALRPERLAWWPVVKTMASSVPIQSASSRSRSTCNCVVPLRKREPVSPVPYCSSASRAACLTRSSPVSPR